MGKGRHRKKKSAPAKETGDQQRREKKKGSPGTEKNHWQTKRMARGKKKEKGNNGKKRWADWGAQEKERERAHAGHWTRYGHGVRQKQRARPRSCISPVYPRPRSATQRPSFFVRTLFFNKNRGRRAKRQRQGYCDGRAHIQTKHKKKTAANQCRRLRHRGET